jgi:putative hydrolase of the HAD superfamily
MDQLLIWDFDGTLAYRRGGMWSAALCQVARQESPDRDLTLRQFRPYLQSGFPWHTPDDPHPEIRTADEWWAAMEPVFERAFAASIGIAPDRAAALAGRVRHVYLDPDQWRLYDDALPVLGRLASEGWTQVVLSNHVPELRDIILFLGLGPYLAAIYSSAETGYEKPHPQAFSSVLATFHHPDTVWMIGDSYVADIAGARSVGVPGILVRRPYPEALRYCPGLEQVADFLGTTTPAR